MARSEPHELVASMQLHETYKRKCMQRSILADWIKSCSGPLRLGKTREYMRDVMSRMSLWKNEELTSVSVHLPKPLR